MDPPLLLPDPLEPDGLEQPTASSINNARKTQTRMEAPSKKQARVYSIRMLSTR